MATMFRWSIILTICTSPQRIYITIFSGQLVTHSSNSAPSAEWECNVCGVAGMLLLNIFSFRAFKFQKRIGLDLAGILGTHGERQRWVGAELGKVWEEVSPPQPTRGYGERRGGQFALASPTPNSGDLSRPSLRDLHPCRSRRFPKFSQFFVISRYIFGKIFIKCDK